MRFCERLQDLRVAKGLTQPALAELAGVSAGALRNWEQGRRLPYVDSAWRVAQALGVTLDELIGDSFKAEGPRPPKGGKRFVRFQFSPTATVEEMIAEIRRAAGSTPEPSGQKKPAGRGRKRRRPDNR
jgi:transcriptional regulator with XRE-family HTH domain